MNSAMAWTPNGSRLILGAWGSNGENAYPARLRIIDTTDPENQAFGNVLHDVPIPERSGASDWVRTEAVASSPDGSRAIAVVTEALGGDLKKWSLRVLQWNLKTGEAIQTIRGSQLKWQFKNLTPQVFFSPDSTLFAVLSGNTVQVWETETARHLMTITNPHEVTTVAFSPSGELLAVGTAQGKTGVLRLKFNNSTSSQTLTQPPGEAADDTAKVGEPLRRLSSVRSPKDLQFEDADIRISDDQLLVLVGKNGEHLLRIDEGTGTAKAQEVTGWRGMKFVPGTRRIVGKTWDKVWVRDSDEPFRGFLPMPHKMVEGDWIDPAVSPDGKILVTRPLLDHFQCWSLETLKPLGEPVSLGSPLSRMQFTRNSKHLCIHTEQGLSLWSPQTLQKAAGPLPDGPYIHGLMGKVAYEPTKDRIATVENSPAKVPGEFQSRVYVRSIKDEQVETVIDVPAHTICVLWADPNHLILSGGRRDDPEEVEGYLYDTFPMFLVRLKDGVDDAPKPIELSEHIWYYPTLTPDGQYVIGASYMETLCWKVGEEQPLWRVPGRAKVIQATSDCVLLHGFHKTAQALSVKTGKVLRKWHHVVRTQIHGDHLWLFDEDEIQVWTAKAGPPKNTIRPSE